MQDENTPQGQMPAVNDAELAQRLLDSMPKPTSWAPGDIGPQEGAAPQAQGQLSAPAPADAALVDRFGNPFNPELHQVKTDGTPVVSPKGRLYARPGVLLPRPARGTVRVQRAAAAPQASSLDLGGVAGAASPAADEPEAPAAPLAPPVTSLTAEADGAVLADLEELIGNLIAGKEGDFTPDERAKLEATAARAFLADNSRLPLGPWSVHIARAIKTIVDKSMTETGRERLKPLTQTVAKYWAAWWTKISGGQGA